MKRRTGLLSTKSWMRSWVTEELPISSSDMLSDVKVAVDGDAAAVRCTTAVAAAGENAVVHDADDRRAVTKTMERIMMASMIAIERRMIDGTPSMEQVSRWLAAKPKFL